MIMVKTNGERKKKQQQQSNPNVQICWVRIANSGMFQWKYEWINEKKVFDTSANGLRKLVLGWRRKKRQKNYWEGCKAKKLYESGKHFSFIFAYAVFDSPTFSSLELQSKDTIWKKEEEII